jgi:hypothetical protein
VSLCVIDSRHCHHYGRWDFINPEVKICCAYLLVGSVIFDARERAICHRFLHITRSSARRGTTVSTARHTMRRAMARRRSHRCRSSVYVFGRGLSRSSWYVVCLFVCFVWLFMLDDSDGERVARRRLSIGVARLRSAHNHWPPSGSIVTAVVVDLEHRNSQHTHTHTHIQCQRRQQQQQQLL